MLSSRVSSVLNRQLKCRQQFNIRALSTATINPESPSAQKQDSNKTENQQQQPPPPRKLSAWLAVALTTGAVTYYFYSYRRTKERLCAAASQIRADLPNYSARDVVERRLHVYGVGVYDLNDYARMRHPGGEDTIRNTVGGSFEEIWESEGMKFHKKREILELLEGMRVGNVEGAVERAERCKTTKVGEGPLCLGIGNLGCKVLYDCMIVDVPQVNAKEYRLELTIDDGSSVKALSLAELRRYPKHSIVSSIPCKRDPTKKEAGPTWTGVQLRDILRETKINKSDYDEIRFECLDASSTPDKPYGSSAPFDRVLTESNFDVLLAYDKDGSEISPQHGYPVRLVMPQAAGAKNVKWLHRIVLVKKTD